MVPSATTTTLLRRSSSSPLPPPSSSARRRRLRSQLTGQQPVPAREAAYAGCRALRRGEERERRRASQSTATRCSNRETRRRRRCRPFLHLRRSTSASPPAARAWSAAQQQRQQHRGQPWPRCSLQGRPPCLFFSKSKLKKKLENKKVVSPCASFFSLFLYRLPPASSSALAVSS